MTVKIDMDMPRCCYTCILSYLVHNIEGDILICPPLGRAGCKTKRRKDCPLQPVEEIKGTISTEDYMKFYEQAEELCNRNPGIKDYEDFNKALRENK